MKNMMLATVLSLALSAFAQDEGYAEYAQPQQGYAQPQQYNNGYAQPQQGYGQPQQYNNGYAQPQQGYGQPQQYNNGYAQPQQAYGQPAPQPKQKTGMSLQTLNLAIPVENETWEMDSDGPRRYGMELRWL